MMAHRATKATKAIWVIVVILAILAIVAVAMGARLGVEAFIARKTTLIDTGMGLGQPFSP